MTSPGPAKPYHILVVDDNPPQRQALAQLLGYRVSTAESVDQALTCLPESVDFVISDLEMADRSGMDLLKCWKGKSPGTQHLVSASTPP